MFPKPTKKPKKGKSRRRVYQRLRSKYLREHPFCEVGEVCQHQLGSGVWVRARATEVHHMRGRDGDMLLDTGWWKATCQACHRWIHAWPYQAVIKGYSAKREADDRTFLAESFAIPEEES